MAQLTTYPQQPGFKTLEPETSAKAAREIGRGTNVLLRSLCFSALTESNLTADEVAARLGETVLAIRPRISELSAMGKIIDTGLRRKNVSGKSAVVWRATGKYKQQELI